MATDVAFRPFVPADKELCLDLFDANCPAYFAPPERIAYAKFLEAAPTGYEVGLEQGQIVGAYGLSGEGACRRELRWILVQPRTQGSGVGSAMMRRATALLRESGPRSLDIAASHLSAPFFAKHGAVVVAETRNGWGPGLHRVDMVLDLRPAMDPGRST